MIWPASCVAIGDRAVLVEGPSGSGKSNLALALIDRGARLISDDAVSLERVEGNLLASPAPNISGLLEVRNLGLMRFPVVEGVPVAIALILDSAAPRFIDEAEQVERCKILLPAVRLWPNSPNLGLRAELALDRYGLA